MTRPHPFLRPLFPSPRLALLATALASTALLLAPPRGATAAELHPYVTLTDSVVRLSDLFSDAGPNAERILGPAPEPGAKIVVPARQLAAIARQYGVDWRPTSDRDEAVLERPARAPTRQELIDALADVLKREGAGDDLDIALTTGALPPVPAGAPLEVRVLGLDFDAAHGAFTADVTLLSAGMKPVSLRVAGRVWAMAEVPVPALRIDPGVVIAPADLKKLRIRKDQLGDGAALSLEDVVGLTPRHPLIPGQMIRRADLAEPPLVRRGLPVRLTFDQGGLSITTQGQALEDGTRGAIVRVLNPRSRAVLDAEVTGPGTARVMPGSSPEVPPQDGAGPGIVPVAGSLPALMPAARAVGWP
jgi:flagella basal body P-ring formation protein FlgA